MEIPAARLSLLALVVPLCACTRSSEPEARTLWFVDRTADSGVQFFHVCGGKEKDYIVEVNGGGVALFDYDNDGDLDIFLVNGNRFPDTPDAEREPPPRDALFRNLGDWRFENVTERAGLIEEGWGCGVCVADIDNDGDLDFYVTNYGPNELWRNNGDGTFTAIGEPSGTAHPGWGSSCAFLDYDRDGLVDLFVVNYLEFDRKVVPSRKEKPCPYKGQKILCGPVGLPPAACVLYRNLDGRRFVDVSEEAGIAPYKGYGLGVAVGDYDQDGWADIYVAADTTDNLLFHNLGDGRFEEVGLLAGVARNDQAVAQAGMGVEFAFVRNAELEDIFVVNYEDDTNTYYRNDGNGFFTETTAEMGLAAPCFKYLGWACFFADFDLDADLDLFIAQGHVVPQADAVASSPGYRQPNKLFLNDGSGYFIDASEKVGPAFQIRKSSRGAAYGDLDGDGDLDLVINEIDDEATVIECKGPPLGRWLAVRTVGTASNRAGIGAVVRVRAGGRVQARRVQSAIGYASACEPFARFGLGTATRVEELTVDWPSGRKERFAVPGIDRVFEAVEGQGEPIQPEPQGGAQEPGR